MRISTLLRIAALGLLLAAIAACLVFLPTRQYATEVLGWVRGMGAWGPALLIVCFVMTGPLLFPPSIFNLAGGFLFGVTYGTLICTIGNTLGTVSTFMVGRTLVHDWIEAKVAGNPRFLAIDRAIGRQGLKVVLVIRLSPMLHYPLLSYAFSATKVSFRNHLLGTLIGVVPGTLMYVYLGTAAKSLADLMEGKTEGGTTHAVLIGAGLVITIVATVLVTRIAKGAWDEVLSAHAEGEMPTAGQANV